MTFWNIETEKNFFRAALESFSTPEKCFYDLKDGYFAYAPKGKTTEGQTLNSRNSLVGQFTEKWCRDFFKPIAEDLGLYTVNSVVCPELGLVKSTDADLAFCKTKEREQKAENIKLIFEIKMSIVNNYQYFEDTGEIKFIGDYKKHKGNPSILRSDSMLKAIGKAINIRVSGPESTKIPIVILGNSPITNSYKGKVDFLKKSGVIQSFISLHPEPTKKYIHETKSKGFHTFTDYEDLRSYITDLITTDMNFFSSMIPKKKLGSIIKLSSVEKTDIERAEKFLELLNDVN